MTQQKVMIAWSSGGSVGAKFAQSLLNLQAFEMTTHSDDYVLIGIEHAEGLYIQDNRNSVVKMAQERGADWLLQLDADISFPSNLLQVLMTTADKERRQIVVGLYANVGTAAEDGSFVVVNCIYGEGPNGKYAPLVIPKDMQTFEVDAAGTGVFLTHLGVFDKMQYPWFWLAMFQNPDGTMQTMNEDIAFCRMARDAGIRIWCEPKAEVVHWKTLPMRSSQFREMYENAMAAKSFMKG